MPGSTPRQHVTKTVGSVVLLSAIAACAGVSEERIAALEAQVAELRQASTNDATQQGSGDIGQRVAALEENSATTTKQMEEMLEVLQREVTRLSANASGGDASSQKESTGGNSGEGDAIWQAASIALGVAVPGVTAEGDAVTVPRSWLIREVEALAAAKGKGAPKLTANKEGVQLRAVKPKSAAAALGFKNGDIIKSIGESSVASAEDIIGALRTQEGNVTVTLLRKKKEKVLTYTITL